MHGLLLCIYNKSVQQYNAFRFEMMVREQENEQNGIKIVTQNKKIKPPDAISVFYSVGQNFTISVSGWNF